MFVFGLEPISSCAEVIFGKNLFLITLYFQWQAQASNLFPPALPWLPPSLSLSVCPCYHRAGGDVPCLVASGLLPASHVPAGGMEVTREGRDIGLDGHKLFLTALPGLCLVVAPGGAKA